MEPSNAGMLPGAFVAVSTDGEGSATLGWNCSRCEVEKALPPSADTRPISALPGHGINVHPSHSKIGQLDDVAGAARFGEFEIPEREAGIGHGHDRLVALISNW